MRKLALVLAAALLAGIGVMAPSAAPTASAATGPKVAIIVGATHASTAGYRSAAEEIYAEAIRYTPNVVRVYSPNATWTKVKAAVNGASVVVYLGHGNGWPSPYTFDPNYTTKDGFGLNYDVNGDGKLSDNEVKYYGEPSIRTLTPAPNAVVLLFHLCYASGNSEPGGIPPSISTARQRADNFAAAFLRTNARAVIASGRGGGAYYIRALFSSRQTIEDVWLNAPQFNDHVLSFASTRNQGNTVLLDPDSAAPSGFYRALTGRLSLRTEDVTGASFADTSQDPAAFVVPGNASPVIDGAPVFGSVEDAVAGAAPVATLPMTARVRIDWREEAVAADGSNVFRVHADNEIEGWMTGASLIPRDTAAPQVWDADDGSGSFSPNGDGVHDRLAISWDLSEVAAWTVGIADGDGRPLATATGEGQVASMLWAPDAGTVADGEYTWTIEATDAWGNGPLRRSGTVQADTQPPVLSLAPAAGEPTATQPVLTPNGDGALDTIAFAVEASEPGRVVGTIRNAAGDTVDTMAVTVDSAAARLTWDGRTAAGSVVPDGLYAITFMAQDGAGNMSEPQGRTVGVYTSLARMRTSAPIFFPQDGDGLAARVVVAFDLARPAAVTWTIVNAAGATVRTVMTDRALGAGARSWAWDGRNDDGAFVPRGQYTAVVRAVDGELSATMRASVRADAFRVVPSDTTPYRGQLITVTVTTAENLSSAPRVAVSQPGVRGWNIGTVRVATGVYRATIRLKPGATGTLRLRAYGRDSGGRLQDSVISVPLH